MDTTTTATMTEYFSVTSVSIPQSLTITVCALIAAAILLSIISTPVRNFFTKWAEFFIFFPIAAVLVFYAERIITFFFPIDIRPSVIFFYAAIYTIAFFFASLGVCYFAFKVWWARMERFVDEEWEKVFRALDGWDKMRIASFWLFAIMFFFGMLSIAVFSIYST